MPWRRSQPRIPAAVRAAPQPAQCAGSISTVWSGSSLRLREIPGAPGCVPGLRPERVRDERFRAGLFHGASDDGGRDEFDESIPRRRSNSATRSTNTATNPSSIATVGARHLNVSEDTPGYCAMV